MTSRREIHVPSFTKVNLGLELVGPRPDGFHEMVTLYQTIGLADVIHARRRARRGISLSCDDASVPTDASNLVIRAYEALRAVAGPLPGLAVHLEKRAPVGGGLGGGSGNAGATLLALDAWLGLSLGRARLAALGAGLGSDVPFFVVGGLALGTGRGERVVPLGDLPRLPVVLAFPGVSVPTKEVFARVRKSWKGGARSAAGDGIAGFLLGRLQGDGLEGMGALTNDLEAAARPLVVGYDPIVGGLRISGALLALLSGSGSTIYGVFRRSREARQACRALSGYETLVTRTVGRVEYGQAILGSAGRSRKAGRPPSGVGIHGSGRIRRD